MSDILFQAPPLSAPGVEELPPTPPEVIKAKTPPGFETQGISAQLLEEYVVVEYQPGMFKNISYLDFFNTLKGLVTNEKPTLATTSYMLPTGCFYIEVTENNKIQMSCYYPECKREIKFTGNPAGLFKEICAIPNIIISSTLHIEKGNVYKVGDIKYMSTRLTLPEIPRKIVTNADRGMGLLPFTNVYDNGRLCFGSATVVHSVTLPDLRPMHGLYELLFSSSFNNDLGLYALKNPPSRADYIQWYKKLAKCAKDNVSFPYDDVRFN